MYLPDRELKPQNNWKKPKRKPEPTQEFIYSHERGMPVVKVRRTVKNGKKVIRQFYYDRLSSKWEIYKNEGKDAKGNDIWVSNMDSAIKEAIKKEIPLFHLKELKQAIADGKPIYFVEGEPIVEALERLGLLATTLIGGAGKMNAYNPAALDVLEGADVILCPDADMDGIKHMDEVAAALAGKAKSLEWLYAQVEGIDWQKPEGGADLKDWIDDGGAIAEVLEAWVTSEKLEIQPQTQSLKKQSSGSGKFTPSEVRVRIEGFIDRGLTGSSKTEAIGGLAAESGWNERNLETLYNEIADEQDNEQITLDDIRSADFKPIEFDPFDYFPEPLAELIISVSGAWNIDPAMCIAPVMQDVCMSVDSSVQMSYGGVTAKMIFWYLVVGESGCGKTRPVGLYAFLYEMDRLRKLEYARKLKEFRAFKPKSKEKSKSSKGAKSSKKSKSVKEAELNTESEPNTESESVTESELFTEVELFTEAEPITEAEPAKETKPDEEEEPEEQAPDVPKLKTVMFSTSDPTESIIRSLHQGDGRGLIYEDEFSGVLKSLDQFKSGGKGDAIGVWTKSWNGTPISVNRIEDERSFTLLEPRLGMHGNIQPDAIGEALPFLKDNVDPKGFLARFLVAVVKKMPFREFSPDDANPDLSVLEEMCKWLEEFHEILFTDEGGAVRPIVPDTASYALFNKYARHYIP